MPILKIFSLFPAEKIEFEFFFAKQIMLPFLLSYGNISLFPVEDRKAYKSELTIYRFCHIDT